jgi:hypothetical protein
MSLFAGISEITWFKTVGGRYRVAALMSDANWIGDEAMAAV